MKHAKSSLKLLWVCWDKARDLENLSWSRWWQLTLLKILWIMHCDLCHLLYNASPCVSWHVFLFVCFLYFQTTVHCDMCFTYRAHDVCCAIHCVSIGSIFTTHHLGLYTNLMGFCLAKEAQVDILVYSRLVWSFSLRLVLKTISFHNTIFVREYCLNVVLSHPTPPKYILQIVHSFFLNSFLLLFCLDVGCFSWEIFSSRFIKKEVFLFNSCSR